MRDTRRRGPGEGFCASKDCAASLTLQSTEGCDSLHAFVIHPSAPPSAPVPLRVALAHNSRPTR